MFQVSLDQMGYRRMEILEFEHKLNRLAERLEEQIQKLETMESFYDICVWIRRTEEQMQVQAGQVKELGIAMESVIRLCRGSEEKILERLEDGPVEKKEGTLFFKELKKPESWSDLIEF